MIAVAIYKDSTYRTFIDDCPEYVRYMYEDRGTIADIPQNVWDAYQNSRATTASLERHILGLAGVAP